VNGYNFTERVRKVLALAREESQRLRHEYVGTEHILLAVIREGEGVAAAVLQNLSVDVDTIVDQINAIVKPGKAAASTGPDLPYTSRAKKILELAMAEARELNHNYVGTEHILLGIIREEKGIAAQVLNDAGIKEAAVRSETLRLLGNDSGPVNRMSQEFSLSPLWPRELDALVAAPENHRLLMENEHVRVLDTKVAPGETTPLHTHRWPATHYFISWSAFVRRDQNGVVQLDTRQTDFSQNEPQVLWGTALPAHTLENVGSTTLHVISVELKH
jgi:hypothetical protein